MPPGSGRGLLCPDFKPEQNTKPCSALYKDPNGAQITSLHGLVHKHDKTLMNETQVIARKSSVHSRTITGIVHDVDSLNNCGHDVAI